MKSIANRSKKNIMYQSCIIPPGGSILLSNDGTIIDEIADNTAAINEMGESLRNDIDTLSNKVDADVTNKLDALDTELRGEITKVKENMVHFNYDKSTNTLTIEEV